MGKIKCDKCGKRSAKLTSKSDLDRITNGFSSNIDISSSLLEKILDFANDMYAKNWLYCENCGYTKKM